MGEGAAVGERLLAGNGLFAGGGAGCGDGVASGANAHAAANTQTVTGLESRSSKRIPDRFEPPSAFPLGRRLLFAACCSLAVHAVTLSAVGRVDLLATRNAPESVTVRASRVTRWQVPTPAPMPTPPAFWSHLDRSAIARIKLTPADEQIVVMAATNGKGGTSPAPHILRVELTPGIVHQRTKMHVRVLTSTDANGVYFRFLIWEIGVPPAGARRLSHSDPDYPGRAYEEFDRDYDVPAIPRIFRGKTYNVEVIATGRLGIASGAFVPIDVR